jgi:ATP-binding cassette subfamily F protein 3
VISGGERARVALALLALRPANLLVLDEPTNDLDVESIEALEDGLEDYEGTVILVSHDRAFLRELATRVWVFDGDHIRDYAGTFVEWEQQQADRRALGERHLRQTGAFAPRIQRGEPDGLERGPAAHEVAGAGACGVARRDLARGRCDVGALHRHRCGQQPSAE